MNCIYSCSFNDFEVCYQCLDPIVWLQFFFEVLTPYCLHSRSSITLCFPRYLRSGSSNFESVGSAYQFFCHQILLAGELLISTVSGRNRIGDGVFGDYSDLPSDWGYCITLHQNLLQQRALCKSVCLHTYNLC